MQAFKRLTRLSINTVLSQNNIWKPGMFFLSTTAEHHLYKARLGGAIL